jgi:signal transduction histidine kinase
VEEAAWFIACEALANAVKHAEATRIEISSGLQQSHLVLEVLDNGIGGANPAGPGLRGIADRAEALGGSLVVSPGPAGGTLVRAVFPCDA